MLFLNHKVKNCGVYQYGLKLYEILSKIDYIYFEIDSLTEYQELLNKNNVNCVIYNYHVLTMPWLNVDNIQKKFKNVGILHECENRMFDIVCNIDPDAQSNEKSFSIPRPIYEDLDLSSYTPSSKSIADFISFNDGSPIFGSFGFGFHNKGFDRIVELINKNYDKAVIKFVIPIAHFAPNLTLEIKNKCESFNKKGGIKLLIIHEFFTTLDILKFLESNNMNLFLYDRMEGRGISSVIDYALSVKRPLGISNSYMFRNIYSECIDVNKTSLPIIINNSVSYCQQFLEKYSHKNMIDKFLLNLGSKEHLKDNQTIDKMHSYSQILQDVFAVVMTKRKTNGYYLEIGTNDPVNNNNTYLMYKHYGWKGLMVEYDSSFESYYKELRPLSLYIINDARNVDYKKILDENNFPKSLDYLQIDLDVDNRSTLTVLEKFDSDIFPNYKFATVTFEHDIYRGDFFETKKKSREIFAKHGYHLLFADVTVYFGGQLCPFEDWYIHPSLVSTELKTYEKFTHEQIKNTLIKL